MSKIYAPAPSGVAERVAHLVKVMFPDLKNAGVVIDLLSVADDDPEVEHALKVRGIPAYACCKAVDVKGRTMGRGDAEITIDEAKYILLPDATKDALLAHEIHHIELQIGKKGKVKLDCRGRPKIKMRPHDIEVGWFTNIAAKFGAASIEVHQSTQIYLSHKQTLFGFAQDADLLKRLEAAVAHADPDATNA